MFTLCLPCSSVLLTDLPIITPPCSKHIMFTECLPDISPDPSSSDTYCCTKEAAEYATYCRSYWAGYWRSSYDSYNINIMYTTYCRSYWAGYWGASYDSYNINIMYTTYCRSYWAGYWGVSYYSCNQGMTNVKYNVTPYCCSYWVCYCNQGSLIVNVQV